MCRTKPAESQVQWTKNSSSGWKVYYTTSELYNKEALQDWLRWAYVWLQVINPLNLFLSLSLSISNAHTCTGAHIHTHTHTFSCVQTKPPSFSLTLLRPLLLYHSLHRTLTLMLFQPAAQHYSMEFIKKKKKSMLGHTQPRQQRKCTVQAHCWAFQWIRHESARNH